MVVRWLWKLRALHDYVTCDSARQCCQVWGFPPRFEEFSLVMGNFSLNLACFGWDFRKFWLELKFQNIQIYENGEFLRVLRILEQPTGQLWC